MEVSLCLVMDVIGVGTGLDSGSHWIQGFGIEEKVHSEKKKKLKKKVKGRRHELERTTEPLTFMVWPLPILLTLCYESI